MRSETKMQVDRLGVMGTSLGFTSHAEYVSPWNPGGAAFAANRHDMVWCMELPAATRDALTWALDIEVPSEIPVVGFEIEGTAPNTKVMAMDALGLAASGVPLGFLVVSDRRRSDCHENSNTGKAGGENNIFRRGTRILRSLRKELGSINTLCLDASWLDVLEADASVERSADSACDPSGPRSAGSGRERGEAGLLRTQIRERGVSGEMRIVEDWTPPRIRIGEREFWSLTPPSFGFTDDPFDTSNVLRKGAFTRPKIDVAWMLQLPPSLSKWLHAVATVHPDARSIHGLYPEIWSEFPLVGFELEGGAGKHASGGMVNLHAHCLFGVTVGYARADEPTLQRQLAWLQRSFGMPRVRVQSGHQWIR